MNVVSILGAAAGTLSLVMLIKQVFDVGLVVLLSTILEYYRSAVDFLLGWADKPLIAALNHVRSLIHIDLHLQPHWKDAFVVMWLYFNVISKETWNSPYRGFAFFALIWGGFVALISSVGFGLSTLSDSLIVAFPIVGVVVFEIGRSVWAAFFKITRTSAPKATDITRWHVFRIRFFEFPFPIAIIGFASVEFNRLAMDANWFGAFPHQSLIALGVFLVALVIWYFVRSAVRATFMNKFSERWIDRFLFFGGTRVGVMLLNVIIGTTIFIALNAGLKLAGL